MGGFSWARERDHTVPFGIPLERGEEVLCRELLRLLPGRRIVCRAEQDGRSMLVKVFPGGHGRKEVRRERAGAAALRRAGVLSPELLFEGVVAGTDWPLVAYEYLPEAGSLRRLLDSGTLRGRQDLVLEVVRLIAFQHAGGLWQQDPHPDNFLLDGDGRVWSIDAGGYRDRKRPLGRRASMDRLGLLVAQFPAVIRPTPETILRAYCEVRGASWDPLRLERRFERAVTRWTRWRFIKYGRKSLRDCSEFETGRISGFHVIKRRELERELLDAWVSGGGLSPEPGCRVLKEGNSQTVWSTRLGETPVVVKRYNTKGRWHALRRTMAGDRAERAWKAAHWLRACGIPTPMPLALIREKRGLLVGEAWLVTGRASGRSAYLLDEEGWSREQVEELARMVVQLGALGLVHGDMKASNFLIGEEGVQVIDLDSLSRPRWRWLRERGVRADRERFLRNWKDPELRAAFEAALAEAEAAFRL